MACKLHFGNADVQARPQKYCIFCGMWGHMASVCRKRTMPPAGGPNQPSSCQPPTFSNLPPATLSNPPPVTPPAQVVFMQQSGIITEWNVWTALTFIFFTLTVDIPDGNLPLSLFQSLQALRPQQCSILYSNHSPQLSILCLLHLLSSLHKHHSPISFPLRLRLSPLHLSIFRNHLCTMPPLNRR